MKWSKKDHALLNKAIIFATNFHGHQVDKGGIPYILHALTVGVKGKNPAETITGILHDLVEDTPVTLMNISHEFGPTIAMAVDAISQRPDETRLQYLARVKANKLATTVKCYDLIHNDDPVRMSRLDAKTRKRMDAKHREAWAALTPPGECWDPAKHGTGPLEGDY